MFESIKFEKTLLKINDICQIFISLHKMGNIETSTYNSFYRLLRQRSFPIQKIQLR